jgi:hypothetical protein
MRPSTAFLAGDAPSTGASGVGGLVNWSAGSDARKVPRPSPPRRHLCRDTPTKPPKNWRLGGEVGESGVQWRAVEREGW